MVFKGFTIERVKEEWGVVVYDIYKSGRWYATAESMEQAREYIDVLSGK